MGEKRLATSRDLLEHAEYLKATGIMGIYIYCTGPGIIRWSRVRPDGVALYCAIGDKGRVWLFVHAEGN